jgi:hypothetical protein
MLSIILYCIIGGVLFSILGAAAAYSREEKPTGKTIGRDWTAGIVITFIVSLIRPSLMPPIDWVESMGTKIISGGAGGSGSGRGSSYSLVSDYPLQIGIQPR